MKYTKEEEMSEIIRRSKRIILRRNYRAVQTLSAITAVLIVALFGIIRFVPGKQTGYNSVYGSLLLGSEAGGYVLVAFVAFLLGVFIAVICLKCRKLHDNTEEEDGGEA